MPRPILSADHVHPAIRETVGESFSDTLDEVIGAVAQDDVVIVGMAQNPWPKKARKALDAAGVPYRYLEYGSYMGEWRRRLALKMWSGWPTFPMVFVKGVLVGGFTDLKALMDAGELAKLLEAPRPE